MHCISHKAWYAYKPKLGKVCRTMSESLLTFDNPQVGYCDVQQEVVIICKSHIKHRTVILTLLLPYDAPEDQYIERKVAKGKSSL
jgi:hypothetical protein